MRNYVASQILFFKRMQPSPLHRYLLTVPRILHILNPPAYVEEFHHHCLAVDVAAENVHHH